MFEAEGDQAEGEVMDVHVSVLPGILLPDTKYFLAYGDFIFPGGGDAPEKVLRQCSQRSAGFQQGEGRRGAGGTYGLAAGWDGGSLAWRGSVTQVFGHASP
jgi:hypothetical protein